MKHLLALALLLSLLISCQKEHTKPPLMPKVTSQENVDKDTAEEKQIEAVVRKAYAWAASHRNDSFLRLRFDASDTIISGFNMTNRNTYLAGLKSTGCFTSHFITVLDNATAQLNNKLSTGKVLWSTEDAPPIAAAEMEEWCMCSNPDEFSTYDKNHDSI